MGKTVQGIIEPLLHKTAVIELQHPLRRAGLSIGDAGELRLGDDGRIAVYAPILKRRFLIRRRILALIGYLGPTANPLIVPALRRGAPLRVRVVGLTPEHLASNGRADLHISVWGSTQPLYPTHLPDTPLA